MHTITSLVNKLQKDFEQFQFEPSDVSRWSRRANTVFYNEHEPHCEWVLLHELAHACLGHTDYRRDIQLLAMERDAWEYAAATLSPRYNIVIDEYFIEDHLDTYRDWIHTKSTCPHCTLTGVEKDKQRYSCLGCGHTWRTNTGTQTQVRRYKT